MRGLGVLDFASTDVLYFDRNAQYDARIAERSKSDESLYDDIARAAGSFEKAKSEHWNYEK